ncbi:hypothetical protein JO861_12450 [Rhodococcus hoagii]|uniref:hypothetical protein n=1 Tax=Rhodococcus hoagii TaxID=43767 RepID=UPI0011A48979|nr:hypothetical protein [Prescottella equi]MBM9837365.1 hypothetical protein [Prescottella equi]
MTDSTSSVYEAWVLALRTWQDRPDRDLSTLPALSADSLPPAAYARLIAHVQAAQSALTEAGVARFQRAWEAARSEHERMRALVELRRLLGRRLQLARLGVLPAEIREGLESGVRRDIGEMQRTLEDAANAPNRSAGSNRTEQERTRYLLRTNGLLALLDADFPLNSLFDSATEPPAAPRQQSDEPTTSSGPGMPPPTGTSIRRVIVVDD